MRNRRGFTLLELMIVIIIIAILVAIALPIYTKTMERSKQAEAVSTLGLIRNSELRYYTEKGFPTGSLSELDVGDPATYTGPTGFGYKRFTNYVIQGSVGPGRPLSGVSYMCDRDTTVDYSGIGLPAAGYTVAMDANGNVIVTGF